MAFNFIKYKEIQEILCKFRSKHTNIQPKLIAVTKSQPISAVIKAIEHGVFVFAENKVQEAFFKFEELKKKHNNIDLHMTGAVQTNKVKKALQIFDCFHTLDREKLAREFIKHLAFPAKGNEKKFFIQVNTGEEKQKSGIIPKETNDFVQYCIKDLHLNIIGLMCIPPLNEDARTHFNMMFQLAQKSQLNFLSMGMSSDYKIALECGSTHVRIGTLLFGQRKQYGS